MGELAFKSIGELWYLMCILFCTVQTLIQIAYCWKTVGSGLPERIYEEHPFISVKENENK